MRFLRATFEFPLWTSCRDEVCSGPHSHRLSANRVGEYVWIAIICIRTLATNAAVVMPVYGVGLLCLRKRCLRGGSTDLHFVVAPRRTCLVSSNSNTCFQQSYISISYVDKDNGICRCCPLLLGLLQDGACPSFAAQRLRRRFRTVCTR